MATAACNPTQALSRHTRAEASEDIGKVGFRQLSIESLVPEFHSDPCELRWLTMQDRPRLRDYLSRIAGVPLRAATMR